MGMAREDWRYLGMIVLVWGALGFLFGLVAAEVISTVNTPTVPTEPTVEQVQPPPPAAD